MKQPTEVEVGRRIRQLREAERMTRAEFGLQLGGYTYNQITRVETGAVKAKPPLLNAIAETFGIRLRWLLTGEGEMRAPKTALPGRAAESAVPYKLLPRLRIAEIMVLRNVALAELAQRSGIDVDVLTQIVTNQHDCRVSELQAIAGALGVPVGDLFEPPMERGAK